MVLLLGALLVLLADRQLLPPRDFDGALLPSPRLRALRLPHVLRLPRLVLLLRQPVVRLLPRLLGGGARVKRASRQMEKQGAADYARNTNESATGLTLCGSLTLRAVTTNTQHKRCASGIDDAGAVQREASG